MTDRESAALESWRAREVLRRQRRLAAIMSAALIEKLAAADCFQPAAGSSKSSLIAATLAQLPPHQSWVVTMRNRASRRREIDRSARGHAGRPLCGYDKLLR